ncbi:hypothetical protein TrST_g10791 [Triparma strigata]|uniref:GAT domain-containing protein n=1 Tax=Triparma strigata TaxID=1606541 RepID=A0A9W7C7J3_9STRA|nr:hypothetical protein TrST_g10791 [Triparma strigata]
MSVAMQTSRSLKVTSDLTSLSDRITLLIEMRKEGSGDDEALLSVVGFLEACAPRVQNLIQAGAEGILGEECFMKCLEVNDRLVAVLSDEGEKKKGGLKDDTDEGILNVEEEISVAPVPLKSPPSANSNFSLAAAAAAADPFAGSDTILSPTPSGLIQPSQPVLRAPSGPLKPVLREPSGGVGDVFDTLPPQPPMKSGGGTGGGEDDLFDDFIGGRKGSKDGL